MRNVHNIQNPRENLTLNHRIWQCLERTDSAIMISSIRNEDFARDELGKKHNNKLYKTHHYETLKTHLDIDHYVDVVELHHYSTWSGRC